MAEILDKEEQKIEVPIVDDFYIDPVKERRLVRKLDLRLMTSICAMYLFNYLDRSNVGNAKTAGQQTDIGYSSIQYSILLDVYFIGYVFFEIPSNMILSRTRPSLYLPFLMILWGSLTCITAAVKNYGGLAALRFLVGAIEAGFSPGVLFVISSWYKPEEQSKRFAAFFGAAILSGAFGGLIAGAIVDSLGGRYGIRGWYY